MAARAADIVLRVEPVLDLSRLEAIVKGLTDLAQDSPTDSRVIKAVPEQRYVLGVAYQPGKDPRIQKGLDGARDYFTEAELEKAAWSYLRSGGEVGLFHVDGTEGAATVVESYIYRGPDWAMTDTAGDQVVIKAGTWLVGAVLDQVAWDLWKTDRITGLSPQGSARRRAG